MVSQQQATASISVIGVVLLYVLWSMVQTGSFLPYIAAGTPDIGNIVVFLLLFSVICGASFAILGSLGATMVSWIRKRESKIEGNTIFSWFFSVALLAFITLLLHIFRLIPLQVSLLSYALVWGIVMYGRLKGKNRFAKYIARSPSTGESKDSVKI